MDLISVEQIKCRSIYWQLKQHNQLVIGDVIVQNGQQFLVNFLKKQVLYNLPLIYMVIIFLENLCL